MVDPKNIVYDESSIITFDHTTSIRKKIAMYLGAKGQDGTFKAIQELFLNTLDEFGVVGCGLTMTYDTKTKMYTNWDDGRGIPLGKLEHILTSIHSGGKLDSENSAYIDSYGQNGCGLAIVCAISDHFAIECHRDGKSKRFEFKDGYKVKEVDRELTADDFPHGTYVETILSDEVLEDTTLDIPRLVEAAELMSYASPNFRINLIIDGKSQVFYSQNGLLEYIDIIVKRTRTSPVFKPIMFSFDAQDYVPTNGKKLVASAKIVFTIDTKPGNKILAYTNRFKNVEGGTHVIGFKSGVTMALNKYMEMNDKITKKYEKMNVSASFISENLVAIVSISMKDPFFKNQTKDQLRSDEVTGWIKSKLYLVFLTWLNNNPKEADKLSNMVLKEAEARYAAKLAKDKVRGTVDKSNFANSSLSKRLEDCLSQDPNEREVFIVEGKSANLSGARDSKFQAYYLLRGKVFNVVSSDKFDNEILKDFVNMLGCGFESTKDISKLRFSKIILLSDADEDGQHIKSLLLGFFWKYYPELIEAGKVYIGNPPLYSIPVKGTNKKVFIKNSDHYDYTIVQVMKSIFSAFDSQSKKELPEEIFEAFLYGLLDYDLFLKNYSNYLNLEPNILENIIIDYKNIQKNNFKNLESEGLIVKLIEENEYHKIISIDQGIHHYNVKIDYRFHNEIYLPIINKIVKDIKFINLSLKNKENNEIFKSTLFDYATLLNSLFSNVIATKIKGLGEMNPDDLKISSVDPKTRLLTKVTMDDAEKASKVINMFLGKSKQNVEDKKNYFESI